MTRFMDLLKAPVRAARAAAVVLHPMHRWRAVRALASRPAPRRIVFICHGNICRSPYAAGAFTRRLGTAHRDDVSVDSAGFIGPGRPSPPEARRVAADRGVSLSSHRSRVVSGGDVHEAGLVVVMDPAQARKLRRSFGVDPYSILVLGDLDPAPFAPRTIHDPVDGSEDIFRRTYDRIDRCLDALVEALY